MPRSDGLTILFAQTKQRWEYRELLTVPRKIVADCNELGGDGWALCGVLRELEAVRLIFRRPVAAKKK